MPASKRFLKQNDPRKKTVQMKKNIKNREIERKEEKGDYSWKERTHNKDKVHVNPLPSASLFFQYNTQLGPPYYILLDTNFINFSVKNKLEIVSSAMDCLMAKCIPCVTDCVIAELEKLGRKFRIAARVAKDPRFERITCTHKGTYADDCLVNRVSTHKCYIVATNDKALKRRIRKIPGVPIMYVLHRKYSIERLPEAGFN